MQISKELHDCISNWLSENLIPIKSINRKADTADIRSAFLYVHGNSPDFYVDNDTINDIMLELGYRAASFASDPYWQFAISQESPALQIFRNEVLNSQ